jgi:hypothetical protein
MENRTAASSRGKRFLLAIMARPITHFLTALACLFLDLFSSPYLLFPIVFVIPVGLAAWYTKPRFAYALALLLPLGRFLITALVEHRVPIPYAEVNAIVRSAVLLLLAYFIARAAGQNKQLQREVNMLQSILPVCMGCKRIRDEQDAWQTVDVYVSLHTDSTVSHGLCPDCAKSLYGVTLTKERNPLESTGAEG